MELVKIEVNTFGGSPFAEHNMPCAVCGVEKAVLFMNNGTFEPCRKCQAKGWALIKQSRFMKWWRS